MRKFYSLLFNRLLGIITIICFISNLSLYSQKTIKRNSIYYEDREYIRNQIKIWGECRNVAITRTKGSVALYKTNGYATTGNIPTGLLNRIKELNNNGEYIDDIQITEKGSWLILYGDNGISWNNVPKWLEKVMKEFNSNQESITSITFNDIGDWIIISREHINTSSDKLNDLIKEQMNKYGGLLAAHLTDNALVLCFEYGVYFLGNVPIKLKKALKNSKIDMFRIKFSEDGSYFFADTNGYYEYNM